LWNARFDGAIVELRLAFTHARHEFLNIGAGFRVVDAFGDRSDDIALDLPFAEVLFRAIRIVTVIRGVVVIVVVAAGKHQAKAHHRQERNQKKLSHHLLLFQG
jgi:hypothetical protein